MMKRNLGITAICLAALLAGCGQAPASITQETAVLDVKKEAEGTETICSEPATEAQQAELITEPETVYVTEPQDVSPTVQESEAPHNDDIPQTQPTEKECTSQDRPFVQSYEPFDPGTSSSSEREPNPTEPKPNPAFPDPPTDSIHIHKWSEWRISIEPTCGSSGIEIRTCTECGSEEQRNLAPTGKHSWQETNPTCTIDGMRTCAVCGDQMIIPAVGHDWVHQNEVGRWETVIICYCGGQFSTTADWDTHASANPDLEYLDAHAGYYAYEEWVITSPAYDYCARCGDVKNS